jgi:Uma2 family endonuclease
MSVNLAKHYFTVSEYERMGETGVFAPDARVELIAGEIFEMSPIGIPHAACVDVAADLLHTQLQGEAIVRVQNPIVLDDFSEPQPDISILRFRDDRYRKNHPRPADILLVIEVSDSTLELDRGIKVPLYARAGIREALIINLVDEQIEHYTNPEIDGYKMTRIFKRGKRFNSTSIPSILLDVDHILG